MTTIKHNLFNVYSGAQMSSTAAGDDSVCLDAVNNISINVTQKCNLKICTWNINGIRAWIKKGGVCFIIKENPDIVCLQEIKCSKLKLPDKFLTDMSDFPYKIFFPAQKEGYLGVAILSKKKPISVNFGPSSLDLLKTLVNYNSPLWGTESNLFSDFFNEGRLIILEYIGFFLLCVYVPNSGYELTKRLNINKTNEKIK